ncbi:hypothetical protein [Nocardia beijingensis]|uniref:hypothetical protein n=1 Tax=Nocardia beijingensis TaxID=95162 RepID=UPI00339F2CC4
MLSSTGNTVADWLHTGEAVSALLLKCTTEGLATCALTHITELPTTREAIDSVLTRDVVPQVIIRVGVAPAEPEPSPPTPRRPVGEILTLRTDSFSSREHRSEALRPRHTHASL